MREHVVLCGGEARPDGLRAPCVELDVSPTAPHDRQVKLDAERISLQLVDELPDALADALEVATYVFVADRLIRRGSNASKRIGTDWQRRIRFRIPVRRLDLWTRDDVREALTDLLTFLSEDRLVFEFSRATRPVAPEPSLGFRDRAAQKIRPDQVILFSGGLDSLAGVCEAVVGAGNSAILVTHKSSKTIASRQDALAEALASRTRSGQLLYAPLWVQRGAIKPMEHSQRLRSFLFATLGMTYARMFGLDTVHFYENGITSFNLPIAEHVVGTRASRTTHPRVLNRAGRLFTLLLDKPVAFSNPYVWMTKRDIVETIEANGCGDLIAQTVSCAHVRDYSFNGTQCGSCSQCVERRVAIVGAGLSLREPPGTYRSDLFTGPLESGQELTMIEAHIQRAWSLTGMTRADFLASYGQSFRCLRELDGSPEENASRMFELHRRYGQQVTDALNDQIKLHAGSIDALLSLPDTSLLAMIRTPGVRPEPHVEPSALAAAGEALATACEFSPSSFRIAFALDEKRQRALFDHGIVLSGRASYKLIAALADEWQCDREQGNGATGHRYVSTRTLVDHLGVSEENLRQQVRRLRADLEKKFAAATGYLLDTNDVIQSMTWGGYRLNPYVLRLEPEDLRPKPDTSRPTAGNVTTPPKGLVNWPTAGA